MSAVADDRVWLRLPGTGGYFHCPAEAVPVWTTELGWQRCDPPEEPNPAIAERVAWEREQEAAATTGSAPAEVAAGAADMPERLEPIKPIKAAGLGEEPKES